MSRPARFDDIWTRLAHLEAQGRINAFIAAISENAPLLKPLAPELIGRIDRYLRQTGLYISSENLALLDCFLPGFQKNHQLNGLIADRRSSFLRPEIGSIYFPVVGTGGLVRRLMVKQADAKALSLSRSEQLDRVGAAVADALSKQLRCRMFWNPSQYTFSVSDFFGNEDPRVVGRSMDLPLALALCSLLTQRPLPPEVSATAQVERDGSLKPLFDKQSIEAKLQALRVERSCVIRMLVAAGEKIPTVPPGMTLLYAHNLGEALPRIFPRPPDISRMKAALDIDQARADIHALYKSRNYPTCQENAQLLIDYLEHAGRQLPEDARVPALFAAYWRGGSCHGHGGDVESARSSMTAAIHLYERHPGLIRREAITECRNSLAVLLKDIFRYAEAEEQHLQIDRDLEGIGALDHTRGKNFSSLSQLYLAQRWFSEAAEMQQKALKMIREKERSRNYGLLALIYTRWGCFHQAEEALDRQLKSIERHASRYDRPYHDWIRAEFLYRRGMESTDDDRRKDFTALHALHRQAVPNANAIADYKAALIYKFDGLALLAEGHEDTGLKQLESAARFFEACATPMLKLLAAAVRAAKSLHFLDTGRPADAIRESRQVHANLGIHKDIGRFFYRQRKLLQDFIQGRHSDKNQIQAARRALVTIQERIPY